MTTLEMFLNFAIGIISAVIASVLTLVVDRRRLRNAIERRLGLIAGDYTITSNTQQYDTSRERVEIRLISERTFSISATGGPTGRLLNLWLSSGIFFMLLLCLIF